MSLHDQIKLAKDKLKPTTTVVVLEDGKEVTERRSETGEFVRDAEDDGGNTAVKGVSNRRRKKVEHAARMGFVVDLEPDLQLANICPGVYLGSQDVANELTVLLSEGITHIANVATGVPNHFPTKFVYLRLDVLDLPWTEIVQDFPTVHEFMKNCVDNGGKVLVHCNAGISRAATFVISYLMVYHGMTFECALETVKKVRPKVRPNTGFIKQLKSFEESLSAQKVM
nr:Dual specificity phosphatase domain containing protein [Haemonchus contortus]CDJ86369.1 Dual specificity phosphatase domain containing protein [Haemonchus contortus]